MGWLCAGMAMRFFCKLYNIASLDVPQLRHLEHSRQTTGHAHCTAALHGMGVSNRQMTVILT